MEILNLTTDVLYVVIIGLCAGYLIVAWRHGSLFAPAISFLEDGMLAEYFRRAGKLCRLERLAIAAGRKLEDLLLCPLCLSPWTSAFIWLLVIFLGEAQTREISVVKALVLIFASATVTWQTYAENRAAYYGTKSSGASDQ